MINDEGVTTMNYDAWEKAVDLKIRTHPASGGLGLDDLPDTDTRALHDAGVLPCDAATSILHEAGAID
jgi:hypothetical protein